MNVKSALAVLLIAILLIDLGDSWLFWRRRRRKPKKPIIPSPCRFTCPRVCTATYRNGRWSTGCRVECKHYCGKKKREAIENEHLTPLPKYIEYYDLNNDGKVTAEELAATLGEIDLSEDMMKAFNITDTDHNGWLSEEELFTSTSLEFENDDIAVDVPEPPPQPSPPPPPTPPTEV